jgi:hypothetical protein
MEYAQLNPDNTVKQVITHSNDIEWDATHKCKARELTPQEAAQFRVTQFVRAKRPEFDPITQGTYETAELDEVGNVVQIWEVFALPPEVIAINRASAALQAREQAKAARTAAVEAIKVTTQAGHTYDGDETSQGRMARGIIALSTGLAPSVTWVLADNTIIQATAAELTEALVLAGQAQAAVWVL